MTGETITLNWPSADLPPEEVAVRAQEEIASLKLRIEELEARRAEAIEAAVAKGVSEYGGYRFIKRTPSKVIDEGVLADDYGEVFDAYLEWWPSAHPPKVGRTDLQKFLKRTYPDQADAILDAISTEDKGAVPVYALQKKKEAGE